MFTCNTCNKEKPNDAFQCSENGKKRRHQCKECSNSFLSERRKARKRTLLSIMSHCCIKCGYDKELSALSFHHVNHEQKEFNISKALASSYTLDRIASETAKCVILCEVCHRQVSSDDGFDYLKYLKSESELFEALCKAENINVSAFPSVELKTSIVIDEIDNSELILSVCQTKMCSDCHNEKPLNDFHIRKKSNDSYNICKKCHHERSRISQQNTKLDIVKIMGEHCCLCDISDHRSMDFHHVDSSEKEFHIASLKNSSIEKAFDELSKCVMLCANHHIEIHAGHYDGIDLCRFQLTIDQIKQNYNSLLEERNPEVVPNKCLDCFANILSESTYCNKCAPKHRKTKIEWPSVEELLEKLNTMSKVQLGKELGVSDNAIKKHIDKHRRSKAGSVTREEEVKVEE